jgi:hypothetical protein
MDEKTIIPVTYRQAVECLYITFNNRVRSILSSG